MEPGTTGFGDQRSGQAELRSCVVLCVVLLRGAPEGLDHPPPVDSGTPPLHPLSYRGRWWR